MEDVKAVPFKIEEGSSALETIELFYCNVNEMPVAVEITGGTVIGINDLLNGDVFANRTWKYMVNGELMEKSARKSTSLRTATAWNGYIQNKKSALQVMLKTV